MKLLCSMALFVTASAAVSASAWAQAPSAGRMLIATPSLDDPAFSETVVLMIEHGEQGSFGVMINRPTHVPADEVFPQLADFADFSGNVYRGGPMLPSTVVMLIRSTELGRRGARPLIGDIFVTTELEILADLEPPVADLESPAWDASLLRLYAGHAAWEPGALEREIARGYWMVISGREDLVFSDDPGDLWRRLKEGEPPGDPITAGRQDVPAEPTAEFAAELTL